MGHFGTVRSAMSRAIVLLVVAGILLVGIPRVWAEEVMTIHTAAQAGQLERVGALLNESPELIKARNRAEQTPLHTAALGRNPAVVELLIARGADVNAADKYQQTPLHYAVRHLQESTARLLLDHRAAVNAKNRHGSTALHMTALAGVDSKEDNVARTAITKLLLVAGADPIVADEAGIVPLHLAAAKGRTPMLDLLLATRAELGAHDKHGRTALHFAALANHQAIIEKLLEGGAEVNAADKLGDTALHAAARRFRKEAAELLLAAGAEVNAKNAEGMTSLHLLEAVPHGDRGVDEGGALSAVAEVLLAGGGDVSV